MRQKIITDSSWAFIQQFSKLLIQFVTSILLARMLMPEDFGLIAIIQIFISISSSVINSGLSQSLIRTEKIDNNHYSTVFWYLMALSILVYFILNLLSGKISELYSNEKLYLIMPWLALNIIFNAISSIFIAKLSKELEFKKQFFASFPPLIFSSIIGLLLAYYDFGVWSLVAMLMSYSILNALFLWFKTQWKPDFLFSRSLFKQHFNFGYKLSLSAIIYTIANEMNTIIIAKFYPIQQVGYYNKASGYSLLPVTGISSVIRSVSYPYFVKLKKDQNKIKLAYKKIMQIVFFVVAPLIAYLIIYAESLFNFLLTEKWLPAVPYFRILCLGAMLYPIHSYNLNILNVYGRTDLNLKLQIIKTILFILILLVSVQWGIIGVLWGNVLNSYIVFLINSFYSGKFVGLNTREQFSFVLPIIILVASVYIINLIIYRYLLYYLADMPKLIIGLIFLSIIYILLASVFRFEPMNDLRNIILDLINKSRSDIEK